MVIPGIWMQRLKRKRDYSNHVVEELIISNRIFVKDFVKIYGSPSIIRMINRLLNRGEISAQATVYGKIDIINSEVERIGIRNNKLYVEVRVDPSVIQTEVAIFRSNRRRAYILSDYEKCIRVYLSDYDTLKFFREDEELE